MNRGEELFLARQALVNGGEEARQLGARRGRGLHNCPEEAARILWRAHRQLLLKTTIPADLVDKFKVPTEISNEELGRLSSYPCCSAAR